MGKGGDGNRGLAFGRLARRFLTEVWILLCPLDLFGTHSDATRRGSAGPLRTVPCFTLDSSVECLTQRRREAESAENARNLANTMNDASNLLEAKHHLKGETTNCSGHCDKTTNLQCSQHSLPLCASA